MRSLLITIFILIAINCYSQNSTVYKIDENISVQLPGNFNVTDTLEQRIITAQIDNGMIIIQRIPNNGKTALKVPNEKELIEAYRGFEAGVLKAGKAELVSSEIVEAHNLKLYKFIYKGKVDDVEWLRACLALILNDYIYSVQLWQSDTTMERIRLKSQDLFSSLTINSRLSIQNQLSYSLEASAEYRWGYFFGKMFGYVIVVGGFIYLIIWIFKKKKNRKG